MNNRLQTLALCSIALVGACSSSAPSTAPSPVAALAPKLVPMPASMNLSGGDPFTISASTTIVIDEGYPDTRRTAELLAGVLRPSTGFPLPIYINAGSSSISLRLQSDRATLGEEGYELTVSRDGVRAIAYRPAGLFRATQTIRQLLPATIESDMKIGGVPWTIPALTITDQPRFAWRGAMLDVARHFFTVDEVKQYIDLLSLYKMNVLHLHLSDDQGWRIEIKSRPELTAVGSKTQVGGGPGGFYTQADFADIIRYAQDRYMMIIPEIDLPGHTNAALSAFPALSCSTRPSVLYTGTDVGWSTFCVDSAGTYALIDDIVREIAGMSPAPYFHMGGDEVHVLKPEQYALFVERVQDIVNKHGKQLIGWEEILRAKLKGGSVLQQWRNDSLPGALHEGGKIIVSGARRAYIDMKYTQATELGLTWAAIIEVRDAYDWNPGAYVKHVDESDILGLEAPMWSETVRNITAVEYLAVPRIQAIAELGWTPQAQRNWNSFRERLAAQAPRWNILGVNYYRSPQIPW